MPSDTAFKALNLLHRVVVKVTGGRAGFRVPGLSMVQLTTIGRRSGEPRTVMLAAPIHTDDRYVVVASRGGDERPPAWLLNLQANPEVLVTDRAGTRPMRARVLEPAEQEELWDDVVRAYRPFEGYQRKTSRVIPLVALEPR